MSSRHSRGRARFPSRAWLWLLAMLAAGCGALHADSAVMFNEVMYHPATDETAFEWVELHNPMAVDVDLSGWSLAGGIGFAFPEGTVIAGGGHTVVAISPSTLSAATGLTNLQGPFTRRLSNAGDRLRLYNNNRRLMDELAYGVDGDWPVGPDGAGVSLCKRQEESASDDPTSWTVSPLVGGTPGRRNFALRPFEITQQTAVALSGTWRFDASGDDLGGAWRQPDFDDRAWASGQGLFRAGTVAPPPGDPQALPTVFSTGMGAEGVVLGPGVPDPHYVLTVSAQSTSPPPPLPATVIQNHPAWLANDASSSWIGPVNPGTANVADGAYTYRTTFNLEGFDPASAVLAMSIGADNRLNDVLFNGVAKGISYAGFSALSGDLAIAGGFQAGANTLDFLTANDGPGANPAGFRVRLLGTARRQMPARTTLPPQPTTYYFRTPFTLSGDPQSTAVRLGAVVADGAVFYLNGTEVLRLNLPAGPIGAATAAGSNVPSPAYLGPIALPNAALRHGTNTLAVELHQADGGARDALFGAELSLTTTNILVPPPIPVAINELAPAATDAFWVELINHGATEVDLAGFVLVGAGATGSREYAFPAQALAPGAIVHLTGATLGLGGAPGDRLFLFAPGRSRVLDAAVVQSNARARWPDGSGPWLRPATPTPGRTNDVRLRDEIVINEVMYHPPRLPATAGAFGTNVLLEIGQTWKHHSLGADLGTAWREPGFDDRLWPAGEALFYATASVLPEPKRTPLPLKDPNGTPIVTYYFRAPFVFGGRTNAAQLTLRPIIDDGAVFYLNGVEVFRFNMPAGEVRHGTFASPGVATPVYTGPFTVPVTNLVAGTNLLAVEVHQFTTNPIGADMAFGVEVSLSGELAPALPGRDSPEAWVELFNRGPGPVSLAGWRLTGHVDYTFTPGIVIAPGGYVVVAGDLDFMRTNDPGLDVLGPFAGRLRHDRGRLRLEDPAGNPADELRYFDSKPWPAYAGGGGSSLELRDPWADNANPDAWAASDESARSAWSHYTYRAVAANVFGPTRWNEFALGLLDAGECLLDDLSVVESPAGTPVPMLQNGSFETGLAAWRALGTHSRSRVEVDPDNPANHVLHLITTGWTYHLSDHLETTLAQGRRVTDGREYEVSFRARWLAGNPHLNTRLYFNRVARTTELPVPSRRGTPGARNSTWVANLGPTFAGLAHSPVVPQPDDPVTVSVQAYDPHGLRRLTLWWAVDGGAWQSTPLLPATGATSPGYVTHSAVLPARPARTLVQFYAEATDASGTTSVYPAGGAASRALYRVDDGAGSMPQLHRFRLLMTAADAAALHAPTEVMSYDWRGLTLVYDDREVFYDVGVHLQSSERGRNDPSRVGFSLKLPPDRRFRGVHERVTLDRSGGYSGRGGRHDEILLWHAINHAGGLLGLQCDLAQVFAPRSQEDSTALVRLTAFDGDYFAGQFDDGEEGHRYKLELVYYPTTTATGDPEAPKLPQPDDVLNVEIQDWGASEEHYRWIFLQENNADADDYTRLMAFSKAFSLSGTALETQTARLMDVDQWLRTLAFKAFTGDADTYTYGLNHNWKIYFRPDDGRALGLLWDMDFCFYQPVNYGYPGSGSANTYKLVTLPDNFRRYHHHLLDLMTSTVNARYLRPWAAHYAGLLGQDWSGAVDYLQQRADYIRGRLPMTTPFVITSNGGQDFSLASDRVTLTGTASMTVKEILVNGVLHPVTWASLTGWRLTVPLPGHANRLTLQGVDSTGVRLTNAVDSITVTNSGALPLESVRINEWMADNAGPGGLPDPTDGRFSDWFELYNPNAVAVNLSGYFLTDTLAQPDQWRIPTNTVIAPRGFLLVWADNRTELNGTGTTGDLHANFQIARGGDTLALFASDGTPQHSVTFGAQLQNVSQGLLPDGNTNAPVFMVNWTPRAANQGGPLPVPQVGNLAASADGGFSFSFPGLPHRAYRVDYTDDLASPLWIPLRFQRAEDGVVSFSDPSRLRPRRFYRVELVP